MVDGKGRGRDGDGRSGAAVRACRGRSAWTTSASASLQGDHGMVPQLRPVLAAGCGRANHPERRRQALAPSGRRQAPVRAPVGDSLAAPPGVVDDRILWGLTTELGHFGGLPGGPQKVVAWGKALEWTVLLAARPPRLGENWLWWSTACWRGTAPTASGAAADRRCRSSCCRPADLTTFGWAGSIGVRSPALSASGRPGCGCY